MEGVTGSNPVWSTKRAKLAPFHPYGPDRGSLPRQTDVFSFLILHPRPIYRSRLLKSLPRPLSRMACTVYGTSPALRGTERKSGNRVLIWRAQSRSRSQKIHPQPFRALPAPGLRGASCRPDHPKRRLAKQRKISPRTSQPSIKSVAVSKRKSEERPPDVSSTMSPSELPV